MVPVDLFPNFSAHRAKTEGADIFLRRGGSGPPLLLLHGYPQTQTHVCWHKVAPRLAKRFTVTACDLKGYGESAGAPADRQAKAQSKRGVAAENEYALKTFHWLFLAQPSALPRLLIGGAPVAHLREVLSAWTGPKGLDALAPAAREAYEAAFSRPAVIAAACADYRAGWAIDRLDDERDLELGRKIQCPVLVLAARKQFRDAGSVAAGWAGFAPQARVLGVDCGHFLAEEAPDETFAALAAFSESRDEHCAAAVSSTYHNANHRP